MLDLPYRPRLSTPAANYWAVALLAVLTPALLFLVARFETPRPSEADGSYELVGQAQAERVSYRLYRTDCGATCSFGLELREELDLPFGVKLVMPKWSMYRAAEGTVRVEGSSLLIENGNDVLGKVAL